MKQMRMGTLSRRVRDVAACQHVALRAQVSPQWAVDELLKMPRTDSGALESRVKSLLPRWRSTAARVEEARFFANVLKLSMHIDDSTLAHGWLLPLGMHRLRSQTTRRDLAALVDKHGLPWATELCTAWFGKHHWQTPPWVQLLAAVSVKAQIIVKA